MHYKKMEVAGFARGVVKSIHPGFAKKKPPTALLLIQGISQIRVRHLIGNSLLNRDRARARLEDDSVAVMNKRESRLIRRLSRRLSLLRSKRPTNRFAAQTALRRYAFCHFLAHPHFGDLADDTMYALTKGKPIRKAA